MAGHICHVLSALSTENQWGNTSHRVPFSKQSNASLVKDLFTTKMQLFSRKWKVVLGGRYTGQILKSIGIFGQSKLVTFPEQPRFGIEDNVKHAIAFVNTLQINFYIC